MKRESLKVEKRTVTGKKVKKLRREGILPGNVYGKDFKSTEVQMPIKEFKAVYKQARETGLVDVKLDDQTIPVLIKNVYVNPKTQEYLHADFHKVNLKEKIEADIPIVGVGEPMAVLEKKGVLLQLLNELHVEALPTELPEKIEVNLEGLSEVDQQIAVSQLSIPTGVTVLNEADQGVFRIGEFAKEEVAPPPVEGTLEGEGAEKEVVEGEEKPFDEKTQPEDDKKGENKKEAESPKKES